ncbi:MAG: Ni/Fe-hydrogenase cytochrome b subunit [Nitrospirae bacterium]|nr:Ni/Fe-hydrogenase cytochrome b subunit [Nitrospirota bacterium]
MMSAERHEIKMFTPLTTGLLIIIIAGAVSVYKRLALGLGATTNLQDDFPWGLWIGFDVLGGVAMAAGGFVIASAVYLLNMKKYKPIARPAILTAFLGYLLAATAIFLDIGHPLRLWHPAVMWQINSIMFIVAIHVILYTTVLAMESSPMFFEKIGLKGVQKFVEKIMMPIALFGTLLSTLHQSSLGAVYLIVPEKLHPLWYSQTLPLGFLVSAVMMGLSMVSFESILSTKFFRHPANMDILSGLARGSLVVTGLYFILKIFLLVKGPGIAAAFDGSMEAKMYLLEMAVGVIFPLILLVLPAVRKGMNSILLVNCLVIFGIVINRMNVGVFGMLRHAKGRGISYFPTGNEIMVTLFMVAAGIFLFKFAVKFFNVLSHEEAEEVH